MTRTSLLAGIATVLAFPAPSGLASAQNNASGPVATYWMTAETTAGMGAMMNRGGGGIGAMLAGRQPSAEPVRSLSLQLGSARSAGGAPSAEHLPPAALGAGPSLPLVTPQAAPADRSPAGWNNGTFERPKGKMLIYWGCGERAGPGQPVVIDFATMAAGQLPAGFNAAAFKTMTPPSAGRHATYGEWPNARSKVTIPASGSLVGDHVVRGNYTPEIRFTLGAGQDFLAPLMPKSTSAASGAMLLNWAAVPMAKAYHATVMGAGSDGTMVMWSSSANRLVGMGIPDYLDEAELRRLVDNRTLLAPAATSCAVPAEVAGAAKGAMLMMTAFGPLSSFSHPARPANARNWTPEWTALLRSKSTHMAMLGMEMPAFGAADAADEDARQQQAPKKKKKGGLLGGIGKAVGDSIIK